MSGQGRDAGWYADPRGEFEQRYWDGQAWTADVARGGDQAVDGFFRPERFTPEALADLETMTETASASASGGKGKVGMAVVVVLAVLAVVAGVLLAGGGDDETATTADDSTTSTAADTTTTEAETTTTTEPETTTTTEPTVEDPSEVIGANVASAVADLEDAGYVVTQAETIDTSVPDGQITGAEEQPDGSVVLTVARPPVTRFIENYPVVDSGNTGFDAPPFDVSGTTYTHGRAVNASRDGSFIEFDLGRDYREFHATFGVVDTQPSDVRVRIEVVLDGQIQSTHDVAFGDTLAIDLVTTDVLRLRFNLTQLAGSTGCCSSSIVAFGDGRLLGVPSEVPPETPG